MSLFMESGPRNGQHSWSLPPGTSYPHGTMNSMGLYVMPGVQNGVVAGPSSSKQQQQHPSGMSASVNGWNKEHSNKQQERGR